MKKLIYIFTVLIFGLTSLAQKLTIDSNIFIESTDIEITENNLNYRAFTSFDNEKNDSLEVYIGNIGNGGIFIQIKLMDKPKVEFFVWSDYNQYDGESSKKIDLEFYELELNGLKFENGERVMGKIKGKTKTISNSLGNYQIEFEGQISHIVGKFMKKRNPEDEYQITDNK